MFYLCNVKLHIRHIAIILSVVFFTILSGSIILTPHKVSVSKHQNAYVQDKQFAFEAPDYSVTASGYEQTRIPVQFSNLHLRKTGNSDFLRNLYFSNNVDKKLGISLINFYRKHSLNESSGYYLYHIRKLLI
ncbi:MAG: hypothetical protein JXR27_13000 [Paludibacteraceae bacterium]|nr:hypothetical protein [Paludibacteraceae bacterium]